MKRRFIFLMAISFVIAATGCLKNENDTQTCTPKTLAQELPAMTKFAQDSSITTIQDESGILYQIIEPGTGATPSINNTITVKYVGRLLDGQKFDSNENFKFQLSRLIKGWQIAIPKLKAGGKMKMIIPSSLAYGCNPVYGIVSNQPLYFYVELLGVE